MSEEKLSKNAKIVKWTLIVLTSLVLITGIGSSCSSSQPQEEIEEWDY